MEQITDQYQTSENLSMFKNSLKRYSTLHRDVRWQTACENAKLQGARGQPRDDAKDSSMLPRAALETSSQVPSITPR